jgi:hypothetical protein
MKTTTFLVVVGFLLLVTVSVFAGGGSEGGGGSSGHTGNYTHTLTHLSAKTIGLEGQLGRPILKTAMVVEFIFSGYEVNGIIQSAYMNMSNLVLYGWDVVDPRVSAQSVQPPYLHTANSAYHEWRWRVRVAYPDYETYTSTLKNGLHPADYIGDRRSTIPGS